jgi:hypothetical protein
MTGKIAYPTMTTNSGQAFYRFGSSTMLSGTNCSVMPLIVGMCWTNGQGSTELCPHVPLGLLEGYEITNRLATVTSTTWPLYYLQQCSWDWTCSMVSLCNCNGVWRVVWKEEFVMPCGLEWNAWSVGWNAKPVVPYPGLCLPAFTIETLEELSWQSWTNQWSQSHLLQPERGLKVGEERTFTTWVFNGSLVDESIGKVTYGDHLTFRKPFYYKPEQVVVFTLEGVDYARTNGVPLDLSQVNLKWNGEWVSPVAWSNEIGSVSYLVAVGDVEQGVTFDKDSFQWPDGYTTTTVETNYGGVTTTITNAHWLSFTGWHNIKLAKRLENRCKIAIIVGHGGRMPNAPDPPVTATDITPNSDIGMFAQQKTDAGYLGVGIMGCWVNATISQVDSLRASQNKRSVNWVNKFTGGEHAQTYRKFGYLLGESVNIPGPDEPNNYDRKTREQIRDALKAAADNMAESACSTCPSVEIEVSGDDIGLQSWTHKCK